jgi:DNA-binding SARP family transcriptional activator/Tfp pilus assembly protein PilF
VSTGGDGALRIQLLGPVRGWRGDQELSLGAARQRTVLAMLAARANHPVSRDELVDGIWGQEPPASAVNGVHIYIAGLRRVLEPHRSPRSPGRTVIGSGQGYALLIDPGHVDSMAFEGYLEKARTARAADDLDTALASLDAALRLWQSAPLPEIRGPWAEVERARLTELRLTAIDEHTDVLLAQGRHSEAVAELAGLVREHPLREQFRVQLMMGLYRCGRQAEALATYADTRRTLIEELGIEPGSALRDLHAQILAGDAALCATQAAQPAAAGYAPAMPVPRELPADINAFTGRKDELATLDCLLAAVTSTAPGIWVVSGTAGVGKTALAVHWAHRVKESFPDGQLYVNLRGYDPGQPVAADDAVARFLRSLGLPEREVPADLEERSARYRSLLNGRRMLVLLDNAASADQVWPLLPGSASCAVVVTSRDSLAGLVARHGARRLNLGLLPLADAIELLRALIGERVSERPGSAVVLARKCSRLPLALRVAAEYAAAHPAMTMSALAGELADEQRRLSLLDADGDARTAVASVFSWSYRHLPAAAAGAFRLLGFHPGADIDPYATAALTAVSSEHGGRVLEQLSRANLIHSTQPRRYAMHDLLRAYARDVAERDAAGEIRDALTRLFDHYLATASAAMNALFPAERARSGLAVPLSAEGPEVAEPASARAWLDAERANLVATAAHCAANGWPDHAIRLAATVFRYLDDGHYSDAIIIHFHACLAAQRMGDRVAEASALSSLGVVAWRLGRYDQSLGYHQRALALSRQTGDRVGEGRALGNLGLVNSQHGRYAEATGQLSQALALFREIGDRTCEARTLSSLGIVDWQQGRYDRAVGYHRQALALYRDMSDRSGEAHALGNLGSVYAQQGRYPQAADCQERALALFREIGRQTGEARALSDLGLVRARQDRHEQAADHQRQALALFRKTGYQVGEAEALYRLGEALSAAGRPHEARGQLRDALARYVALGLPEAEQVRARLSALGGGS